MKRTLLSRGLFALVLCATLWFPALALAQDPTPSPNRPNSAQLIDKWRRWDGKTITFTGEAITQAMRRGDYAWIHLNDDPYYLKNVEEGATLGGYNSGMAVWIPTKLTEKIGIYGDYTHEGDVVVVRGVFNAACSQHGGDMDIHATALRVVTPGHEFREPIKLEKLAVAVLLLVLAGVLWFFYRRAAHVDMFGPFSLPRRKRDRG